MMTETIYVDMPWAYEPRESPESAGRQLLVWYVIIALYVAVWAITMPTAAS